MFKVFLLFFIVLLLVIGIIFIIKKMINTIEKEYKGANIISFFFPIVGLIIYAVNIGKNDKLAKSSIKEALYGLLFTITLNITIFTTLYGIYKIVDEERKEITVIKQKPAKVDEKYYTDTDITNYFDKSNKVIDVDVRTTGKITNIKIVFTRNTKIEEAKEIVNGLFDNNIDYNYEYQFFLDINDTTTYIGYHRGNKNKDIIWSKNNNE